jgi:lipopolysaccharide export system protein LptA
VSGLVGWGVRASSALLWVSILAAVRPVLALEGDDRQPMAIEADRVELEESKHLSIYDGNVVVDQGTMHVTADHVTVYHREDRRIRHIVALGNPATYRQQMDKGQGEVQGFALRMDYDADKDLLILTDQALLIQGADRMASDRIVYDRAQGQMHAGGSERVKILFNPEQHQKKDQEPKSSPGPAKRPKAKKDRR